MDSLERRGVAYTDITWEDMLSFIALVDLLYPGEGEEVMSHLLELVKETSVLATQVLTAPEHKCYLGRVCAIMVLARVAFEANNVAFADLPPSIAGYTITASMPLRSVAEGSLLQLWQCADEASSAIRIIEDSLESIHSEVLSDLVSSLVYSCHYGIIVHMITT